MKHYDFGSLRFVDLYTSDCEISESGFQHYLNAFSLTDNEMQVAGAVNGIEPVFIPKGSGPAAAYYIYDIGLDKLVQIADNREHLDEILGFLSGIWRPVPGAMFLEKTAANMKLYETFKQQLAQHPETDMHYWLRFAFREFNIRFDI